MEELQLKIINIIKEVQNNDLDIVKASEDIMEDIGIYVQKLNHPMKWMYEPDTNIPPPTLID